MAGLHSSDIIKFVQYGLHTSGFVKFVHYGWITQ